MNTCGKGLFCHALGFFGIARLCLKLTDAQQIFKCGQAHEFVQVG